MPKVRKPSFTQSSRSPKSIGHKLQPDRLRHELAKRGLTGAQLAKLAGVTPATVSHALSGHAIAAPTLKAISLALTRMPALPVTSELLADVG